MDSALPNGIERAVFGTVTREDIDAWLSAHVRTRLGVDLARIVFRSGRLAAVYGGVLSDGRQVAVKVHRSPAQVAYLRAAVACQRRLADAGFPCPQPLDGPATTDGLTAVIEMQLTPGEPGNGHEPGVRRAMAHSLHEQLQLLRGVAVDDLVAGPPAWSRYQHGPWPKPHDPIFDFATTPPDVAWLDELARRAAGLLEDSGPPEWVAHADWNCANLRFLGGQVSASYDWDSLAAAPEAVLVGLSAAGFTSGGTVGADTPTIEEMRAFLRDYDNARVRPFSEPEQRTTAAAITWVLAYNARCEVSFRPGQVPLSGFPLDALTAHGDGYLDLRW